MTNGIVYFPCASTSSKFTLKDGKTWQDIEDEIRKGNIVAIGDNNYGIFILTAFSWDYSEELDKSEASLSSIGGLGGNSLSEYIEYSNSGGLPGNYFPQS